MQPVSFAVEDGNIAPTVEFDSDYGNIKTLDDHIVISGHASKCDALYINDESVLLLEDDSFSYDHPLGEGHNIIYITALCDSGDYNIYEADIQRIIPAKETAPWIKISILTLIIILVIIYSYSSFRSHRCDDSNKRKYDIKTVIRDLAQLILVGFIMVIIFKVVLVITVVQSGSMEPTLPTGSTVIYNRLDRKIERGEMVLFISDEYFGESFGKRVIGLPGDIITFKDGKICVNGSIIDESAYLGDDAITVPVHEGDTFTVPTDSYFMLGDNREQSEDSRYWDEPYIHKDKIKGTYLWHTRYSLQGLLSSINNECNLWQEAMSIPLYLRAEAQVV